MFHRLRRRPPKLKNHMKAVDNVPVLSLACG
jgi:hypothetical protein